MTRAIGVKMGISKKDDYPPVRCFEVPIHSGPLAGKVCDRDEYETMLNMYYQKRGWDSQGIPPLAAELS